MARARTSKGMRKVRHARVRKKIHGTPERPRLSVYRSLNHVYAQVIDDEQGNTLASASSLEGTIKGRTDGKLKSDVAKMVGTLISERAKEKGITTIVFDRGGYLYHGRVKALAEAVREGGLVF